MPARAERQREAPRMVTVHVFARQRRYHDLERCPTGEAKSFGSSASWSRGRPGQRFCNYTPNQMVSQLYLGHSTSVLTLRLATLEFAIGQAVTFLISGTSLNDIECVWMQWMSRGDWRISDKRSINCLSAASQKSAHDINSFEFYR